MDISNLREVLMVPYNEEQIRDAVQSLANFRSRAISPVP